MGPLSSCPLQQSKTYYALKMMQKARIVKMSQQHNIVMEKSIMMKANHPYVRPLF